CSLAECGVPDSVQHDDLHQWNVYRQNDRARVLDWGDASISHPFFSLVVTFRFLEESHGLGPDDPWFRRLRDAYLEPLGRGLTDAFTLAMRVGAFAHPLVELRHRDRVAADQRAAFDESLRTWLQRALGNA